MAAEDWIDLDGWDGHSEDDQAPWYDDRHSPRDWGRHHPVMNVPNHQTKRRWNGQPVVEMESSHVMNAILWCERKFAQAKDAHYKCHGALNSSFYFESVEDMYPDYKHLRNEWERRKNE